MSKHAESCGLWPVVRHRSSWHHMRHIDVSYAIDLEFSSFDRGRISRVSGLDVTGFGTVYIDNRS